MDAPNTLFLRLEGPLQAWGANSKFVIRRTMEVPTKSGVLGLVCCAMGLSRQAAREKLYALDCLALGVRIDRAGTRWWDYHTVGAGYGLLTAEGKVKRTASTKEIETLVSRREYLCDASFLAVLQGAPGLISEIKEALDRPVWPLFLGRKSCPPSVPIFEAESLCDNLLCAMGEREWRPRFAGDPVPPDGLLPCLIEWRPSADEPEVPMDAEVWYDVPVSFDPPVHEPRPVIRTAVKVPIGEPLQRRTPPPPRPRADYQNSEYKPRRLARLSEDHHLCVFCKQPATTVQHITYRHAGGEELPDELRSLCRLCHDAVTMIEYGLGMGLDRINPEEPRWREQIIRKREEIIRFRSLSIRRRRLSGEEVE
ncbi:MAG: type I-E CRISPR-associated protein Cas5/CasD [Acidobacteriota bacterium]